MNRRFIKILGERNTGTNYLQQLLELNLDADLLPGTVPPFVPGSAPEFVRDAYFMLTGAANLGWKHAIAPFGNELARIKKRYPSLLLVTLTKNPYSWLLSLHRHPYHQRSAVQSLEEFLQSPWPTVRRERHPGPFPNPVIMWNEKNASYVTLGQNAPCCNLTYERLLQDPQACLGQITSEYGVPSRPGVFRNVQDSATGEKEKGYEHHE